MILSLNVSHFSNNKAVEDGDYTKHTADTDEDPNSKKARKDDRNRAKEVCLPTIKRAQ